MESSSSREFEGFSNSFSNSWNELMEMKYLIKSLRRFVPATDAIVMKLQKKMFTLFANNTFD